MTARPETLIHGQEGRVNTGRRSTSAKVFICDTENDILPSRSSVESAKRFYAEYEGLKKATRARGTVNRHLVAK